MSQFSYDCPHCKIKNVAFTSFGEMQKIEERDYVTSFYCRNCRGGIIVETHTKGGNTAHKFDGDIRKNNLLEIIKVYPTDIKSNIPEYLPENICKFYLQAVNNYETKNYDASAIMSRKVLEVAVKTLDKESDGNLFQRIEKLSAQNFITKDLKDWAHIIRDDGNTAVHENDPVTPTFAEELLLFTQMFLMYTFSMPNMVKEKRKSVQSEKKV